ncbi:deoxyribodipyrimidine photo-lyase [Mesorhizobium sp. CAU 1741]|uniref:cryptochrome/photolyase family protein n=1 Tax=Mesorhizobium sp. CAU 1741 TaxID=3140366 RepID=UPI00325A943B
MKHGTDKPVIVLFRRDLRIGDNRALAAAADTGSPILALFILDEQSSGVRPRGAAALWWLHHSLATLAKRLDDVGVPLVLREGRTGAIVEELVSQTGAEAVFWNRRYDPGGVAADSKLKQALRGKGIKAESFDGFLLHEPTKIKTGAGSFYKVFTPFWKALEAGPEPRDPVDAPTNVNGYRHRVETMPLDKLVPLPTKPDWAGGLRDTWTPGEAGALERLEDFLADGIDGYAKGRDHPSKPATSGLSPHLAHGEITPYQIFAALKERHVDASSTDIATFRKEVGWREFCHHLLFHNPALHEKNFQPAFDDFHWHADKKALRAWQRGLTGYPIVDAGMRELWHTGVMHNRVRMIAASLLTKHLLIDWRDGERWFWDTLVDADEASNPANWQWVAGSGADAAPYFRIFNPVLQGEKFDPEGAYVRRWVPELEQLPDKYLHKPWEAPEKILADGGIKLGDTYPRPIVDHAKARDRALSAYRAMRGEQ